MTYIYPKQWPSFVGTYSMEHLGLVALHGGFRKWGYPDCWMVFVGENPKPKWMNNKGVLVWKCPYHHISPLSDHLCWWSPSFSDKSSISPFSPLWKSSRVTSPISWFINHSNYIDISYIYQWCMKIIQYPKNSKTWMRTTRWCPPSDVCWFIAPIMLDADQCGDSLLCKVFFQT